MVSSKEQVNEVDEKEDRDTTKKVFNILGDIKALLTKEYAEELLKPLSKKNAFTHICLSNWSFGDEVAEAAARALSASKDKLVDMFLKAANSSA
jgi:hypothetical protein